MAVVALGHDSAHPRACMVAWVSVGPSGKARPKSATFATRGRHSAAIHACVCIAVKDRERQTGCQASAGCRTNPTMVPSECQQQQHCDWRSAPQQCDASCRAPEAHSAQTVCLLPRPRSSPTSKSACFCCVLPALLAVVQACSSTLPALRSPCLQQEEWAPGGRGGSTTCDSTQYQSAEATDLKPCTAVSAAVCHCPRQQPQRVKRAHRLSVRPGGAHSATAPLTQCPPCAGAAWLLRYHG